MKQRFPYSATIGATAAIVFVTVLTIVAEMHEPVKTWLKATFSHHWVGKGVLSVALFCVFALAAYALSQKKTEQSVVKNSMILFWTAACGTVILSAFFVYETLGAH